MQVSLSLTIILCANYSTLCEKVTNKILESEFGMYIQLKDASFAYNTEAIFKQLNLRIEKNHTYVILGKSGIGKSTLLSILKGLRQLSEGTIHYQGTNQDKIEIVFQDLRLFPWQTVKQALEMPLIIEGVASKERRSRITKCVEQFNLTDLATRYPNQLSGGQKQRVAMARGLVTQPDFLLLDEPTSSLDQDTKEHVQDTILQAQRRYRNGLVIVTHDTEEAAYLGETILVVESETLTLIDNPIFHLEKRRDHLAFYEFSLELKQRLRKGERNEKN